MTIFGDIMSQQFSQNSKNSKFEAVLRTVGLNIRKIRHQNGLTQLELAKKAEIALLSLHKIEKGIYGAKLQTLFDIASALNVNLIELLADQNILFLNKEKLSLLLKDEGDNK